MGIRLDVNLFDYNGGKAKKTNCVPLKDFEISKKNLSDIRAVLIDNGGLDASKAGIAFCTPNGALVNDSTSFVDYMEILSDDVEEEEKEEEMKNEGEDAKEKSAKSVRSAKATVHNVYIKGKEKKGGDRTAEAKELIKKELNLKLSDKPELLQTSLDQLATSFNRADWMATENKTAM
ncbi:uncharacterized protein N7506_008221 [Penicillium brevicompactum]|uniref:uncharacterized protein n=1 Tax=Penicillium brevicompactum TaxID=5074 RepID=UPI00254257E9|nr:uncharacterized protein N7506_008221 [Penicillium brevicompactum]KAJ5325119.1 hypothetical protein N7506_008221 [Penicillium brevicompactum]